MVQKKAKKQAGEITDLSCQVAGAELEPNSHGKRPNQYPAFNMFKSCYSDKRITFNFSY
jgi:hypothetical protein